MVYVFGPTVTEPVLDVTETYLNYDTVHELQIADHAVYSVLTGRNANGEESRHLSSIIDSIQQMPVVSIPVHFDRKSGEKSTKRSFVLRPFITRDFMTGKNALPGKDIPENVRFNLKSDVNNSEFLVRT